MSDAELLAAYFATRWAVRLPESTLTLQLTERFRAPPALLPAGIVTAYNPASELQSLAENEAAQHRLAQALTGMGASLLPALAAGTGEEASLWTEPGFLVTHLSRDRLVALGERFRQNAIVWIDAGGRASLVSTRHGFFGTSPGDVLPEP